MTNTDAGALERWFHLSEQGTTPRTEILAGVTTFLTLAYILFVQPALMSSIGLDFGAVFVATCLASAFATLLMAGLANYPIAVAPLACSSLPRPGSGSGSGLSWPFHVP